MDQFLRPLLAARPPAASEHVHKSRGTWHGAVLRPGPMPWDCLTAPPPPTLL
ncbi:hypothetical protein P7K49_014191 [Saguinus oedipus]|uniref:Uncharacterized protein n=1 Tax=Saguinus oedipus TaxID=9490 RepID=A0ABQ9VIQ9_SAGOE|nr:hypothetical protein P7K49_014191 [Saguinus oedipus]